MHNSPFPHSESDCKSSCFKQKSRVCVSLLPALMLCVYVSRLFGDVSGDLMQNKRDVEERSRGMRERVAEQERGRGEYLSWGKRKEVRAHSCVIHLFYFNFSLKLQMNSLIMDNFLFSSDFNCKSKTLSYSSQEEYIGNVLSQKNI